MGGRYTRWKVEGQSFRLDQEGSLEVHATPCYCSYLAEVCTVVDCASKDLHHGR
jgi:hypothetical protein